MKNKLLNLLSIILFVGVNARAELPLHRLEVEFSKGQVYPGEQVRCDFILYTRFPSLEVEVAKFPEFRGYWKSNTVLRQGPVQAAFSVYGTLWNRILIGSYELVPMIEEDAPALEPMKLVIRRPDPRQLGESIEETLISQIPKTLKILKLPSAPKGETFSGAVGEFSLRTVRGQLFFQPEEPTVLRVLVEGTGNFQEINELNISFPPQVKVLAKDDQASGVFPYHSKVFEWTLSVNADAALTIPAPTLLYFDPNKRLYQKAQGAPIRLEPIPTATPQPKKAPVHLKLTSHWKAYQSWANNYWFWAAQALPCAIWVALLRRGRKRKKAVPAEKKEPFDPSGLQAEAKKALEAADFEKFFRIAEKLTLTLLQQKSSAHFPGEPASTILKKLESRVAPETIQNARTLFEARDAFCYSPHAQPPSDPSALWKALEDICAA